MTEPRIITRAIDRLCGAYPRIEEPVIHTFPTAEYHPLEFTEEDSKRAERLDEVSGLVLLSIARVLAETPATVRKS